MNKQLLSKVVNQLSKQKSDLVWGMVAVRTLGSKLILHTPSLKIEMLTGDEMQQGEVVVDLKELVEALKPFDNKENLVLKVFEGKETESISCLTLSQGSLLMSVPRSKNADNFKGLSNNLETNDQLLNSLAVDKLDYLMPAICLDPSRSYLNSVFFSSEEAEVVASDGHRLHAVKTEQNNISKSFLLKLETVSILKALGSNCTFSVEGSTTHTLITGKNENGVKFYVTSAKNETNFPPYKMITQYLKNDFTVALNKKDQKELVNELKRIEKMPELSKERGARGKTVIRKDKIVTLGTTNGHLELTNSRLALKTSVVWNKEVCARYNPEYIIDALSGLDNSTFCLTRNNNLDPMQIKNDNGYAVIMPMRM
jgi:DNA polymerase III sliding clamp (beta) subunit (PCNA family)